MENQAINKLKKISKSTTAWIIALVVLGGSGLGVGIYYIVETFTKGKSFINTTEQQTYIRERSMSLRFNSVTMGDIYEGMFGTAWIIGKDTNKYYLATNIHVVAPAVINTSLNLIAPPNDNTKFEINKNFISTVTLGYPKDPSKIYTPGNDLNLEYINNFPTIDYLGTSYNTYSYAPALPSGKIPYSMTDIAILGFDFSSTTSMFKQYLKYYDNNPTKFSTIELTAQTKNTYFIGGYPAIEKNPQQIGTWSFGDSQNIVLKPENGLTVNPQFSNGTTNKILDKEGYLVYGSNSGTIFPNNIKYAEANGLNYNNYSYQNVANQISISDLNLEPGSSGSMVINQNFEVCGIYWGVYNAMLINNNTGTSTIVSLGTFDIFVSPSYAYGNSSSPIGTYGAYNTLSDIKSQIPTISGGNWANIK